MFFDCMKLILTVKDKLPCSICSIFSVIILIYYGMEIPLSDNKHRFVRDNSYKVHWKSETMSETNSAQDKFSLRQNF